MLNPHQQQDNLIEVPSMLMPYSLLPYVSHVSPVASCPSPVLPPGGAHSEDCRYVQQGQIGGLTEGPIEGPVWLAGRTLLCPVLMFVWCSYCWKITPTTLPQPEIFKLNPTKKKRPMFFFNIFFIFLMYNHLFSFLEH